MNDIKTKLLQTIRASFPDLKWKSSRYISVGFDHDVIILDNATIFRFPKDSYSKNLLREEIALLKILAEKITVAVPAYNFIAKDFSCASYPMIIGKGLTEKIYKNLTDNQKNALVSQIAGFLTQLHSVSLAKIKHLNIRERFAETELKQLHKGASKYIYPGLSSKEMAIFETFFNELSSIFKQTHKRVLVHGDFSGDHMIITQKNNLSGVIDFTDRAIHDSAFDFVFLWEFGMPFVEKVIAQYSGDKKNILQRSKVYAEASAIWNMIEALKKKKLNYDAWYRRFKKVNQSR